MSILIIGTDGLIGSSLKEACMKRKLLFYETSRKPGKGTIPLDLAEDPSHWQFPSKIKIAVICAAATKLSLCEMDPLRTYHINVQAPAILASRLQAQGSAIIFLSTSLVFGGRQKAAKHDDPLHPETTYGHQKAEAELLVQQTGPHVTILRLTKVVHPSFRLFTDWAVRLKDGIVIRPLSDLVFSPIPLAFVVDIILDIAKNYEPGIFQLSGDRDISYAFAAGLLAKQLGVSASLIQSCSCCAANSDISFIPFHTTMTSYLPGKSTQCPRVGETLANIFKDLRS